MNEFRRFKGFYRFKREGAALPYFYAPHHHFAFRISHFAFRIFHSIEVIEVFKRNQGASRPTG